jgi:hypothetical protein
VSAPKLKAQVHTCVDWFVPAVHGQTIVPLGPILPAPARRSLFIPTLVSVLVSVLVLLSYAQPPFVRSCLHFWSG